MLFNQQSSYFDVASANPSSYYSTTSTTNGNVNYPNPPFQMMTENNGVSSISDTHFPTFSTDSTPNPTSLLTTFPTHNYYNNNNNYDNSETANTYPNRMIKIEASPLSQNSSISHPY